MSEFFKQLGYFVSDYGLFFTAIATAIATVALWRVTKTLAIETKRMADSSSKPLIVASISASKWSLRHVELEVENTGTGTAFEITVEFNPPLVVEKSSKTYEETPLQSLSLLKPGQKFSSFLGEFNDYLEDVYSVTTKWKINPTDKGFEKVEYKLSIKDFENVTVLGEREPLVQIAREVKKIREDWRAVASGNKKIEVNNYSQKDREAKRKAEKEFIERQRKIRSGNK